MNPDSDVKIPAKTPVTVLSSDVPKGRTIGFQMSETIGVGVVNPRSVSRTTLFKVDTIELRSLPVFKDDENEVEIRLTYIDGNINVDARVITYMNDISASTNAVVASFDGTDLFTWEKDEDGVYKETYEATPENLRALFLQHLPAASPDAEVKTPPLGFFPWTFIIQYMRESWEVCEVMVP